MAEKNPLTGKKPSISKAPASKTSGGLAPSTPTQIGKFSDSIDLPFNVPVHDPNSLIPGDIYNPASSSAPRMKRDEADRHIETSG